MKIHHMLALFLALALSACAGSSKPASSPGGGYYQTEGSGYSADTSSHVSSHKASAPRSHGNASGASHTSPTQSYDSGGNDGGAYQPPTRSESERRPQERPGLGTVFGETMTSHVRRKTFVRAASRPFAAIAMHYNDEEGVRAHASYRGRNHLVPYRAHTPAGGITVALTDQYGNLLSGGDANGRALIVGREGQRYNIVIQNQTGGRYEVVLSVDGLDVIDGRPANLSKRGYILEPHSSLSIDGFRRSESAVAAFRFGRVSQSYAARTSGDRNVGVVGAAFFAERGSVWTTDELRRRDTADPFPGERGYAQPPRR